MKKKSRGVWSTSDSAKLTADDAATGRAGQVGKDYSRTPMGPPKSLI